MLSAAKRIASVFALSLFGLAANAQDTPSCGPTWYPGLTTTGVTFDYSVQGLTRWDADGPGPQQPTTLMYGYMTTVGPLIGSSLATFDSATRSWTVIREPGQPVMTALAATAAGDLYAGESRYGVKRRSAETGTWSDTNLLSLFRPSGLFEVWQMAATPNGDVFAICRGQVNFQGRPRNVDAFVQYSAIQGTWRSAAFFQLNTLATLIALPDGRIMLGSGFSRPYDPITGSWLANFSRMHIYDPASSTWTRPANVPTTDVLVLELEGTQNVLIGSYSTLLSFNIATEQLSTFGQLASSNVNDIAVRANGDIVVNYESRFFLRSASDSLWRELPAMNSGSYRYVAESPQGDLIAAGAFNSSNGKPLQNVALYDSELDAWVDPDNGMIGFVSDLDRLSEDEFVAVGLRGTNGTPLSVISKYSLSNNTWSSFSAETASVLALPSTLLAASDGTFYVGGQFETGFPSRNISRFDPVNNEWRPVSSGTDQTVTDIIELPDGDLLVGGSFSTAGGVASPRIARYSPSDDQFRAVEFPSPLKNVVRFLRLTDGRILVVSENNLLLFNPQTQSLISALAGPLSAGTSLTSAAQIDEDRVLIAAWMSTSDRVVFEFSLSSGLLTQVADFDNLPKLIEGEDGHIYAFGTFTLDESMTVQGIARWNDADRTFDYVATGLVRTENQVGGTSDAVVTAEGNFLVGGSLIFGASEVVHRFARFSPTGLPWIARQPESPGNQCRGGSVTLTAALAGGTGDAQVLWHKDGVPLDPALNPSAATPTLELSGLTAGDAGNYTAVFTNACGTTTSEPALVNICIADFDCSSEVDLGDLLRFFNCFDAMDPCADLNADTQIDMDDFYDFFNAYDVEC